jgi:hypothetical protein
VWEEKKDALTKEMDAGLLEDLGIADWAQANNEQHVRCLSECTALKQTVVVETSAKLKPAKKFVESLGKGVMTNWEMAVGGMCD